jgi:hypothetical protein
MLNLKGQFMADARPQTSAPDGVKLPPLVIPDGKGPWALRYIWVQHRDRNEEFIENYFNKGNNSTGTGLNLRKQTAHMQDAWNPHNKIFEESRDNGNLIWRVKAYNALANSIDYIEVWRSRDIIRETFGARKPKVEVSQTNDDSIKAASELARNPEEIVKLRQGLAEAGFAPRVWSVWPQVHPLRAMRWYQHFLKRWENQDRCVINTRYNKELNPWEPFLGTVSSQPLPPKE